MFLSRIKLTNWRNFATAETKLVEVNYLLGPNASGKSNFLDVFRFLRDIAKPSGGGLQKAIEVRGTMENLRCLHARRATDVEICIDVAETLHAQPTWQYTLRFNLDKSGPRRPVVKQERVYRFDSAANKQQILARPDADDAKDPQRLTETALEQTRANAEFRQLAEFFANITYAHLVPQLLKFADDLGGRCLEDDPFGQGFLQQIAMTPERIRNSRLQRIEKALQNIIPQMRALEFVRDAITGSPHLQARYMHHRPQGAWQREQQFSDGTLRLISLFWLLLGGSSLLLLEEPELSLNEEIVSRLPRLLEQLNHTNKTKRQTIITTHSRALLSNPGIDPRGVVVLAPTDNGTQIHPAATAEKRALDSGFSPADVMLHQAQKVSTASDKIELTLA